MMNDCIDCSDVSVEVRRGIVVLEGSVLERRVKYMIEDVAAECMGATDIENHIRVVRADETQQGSAAAASLSSTSNIADSSGIKV